jgi:DNA-binding winged helix-turn-helix (wHTH) protein
MYVKPATEKDMNIIFDTFEKKYNVKPTASVLEKLVELSGGHVQYLQLSLIILNQKLQTQNLEDTDITALILQDERITLQSDEIWDSLTNEEQVILTKLYLKKGLSNEEKINGKYLFETGLVQEKNGAYTIFSPLFEKLLGQKQEKSIEEVSDFTKKENALFTFLKDNMGEVCEREKIIEAVWPEYEEYGVSDWTIDRLVARLRTILKNQKSRYLVVTVKTRGYKLIEE